MNNILSDAAIQRVNDYDLSQIKSLFDRVRKDTQFSTRQNQQLYINNRIKLIAASSNKPFGRAATGVPVYARKESKGYTGDYVMNIDSHKDFVSMITSNKAGYLSGIEIVSENTKVYDEIEEFMKLNTFSSTHIDLVSSTCAYATKALRLYVDSITKKVTYSEYEPWTYAPFYDKTGRLVGVMQWENVSKYIQDNYQVGEYKVTYLNENEDMYFFTSEENAVLIPNTQDYPSMVVSNIEIDSGRRPHTFNGVPVVEFWNNSDKIGDVEKTLDSQDAYDELVSKASTSYGAFADVLLIDKTKPEEWQAEQTKEEFKEMMQVLRDSGKLTGDWEWLTKNYEGYQNLLLHINLLNSNIFEGSNSFDPNQKSDTASSPTKYQVEQKYKPLIDSSMQTEAQFRRSYMELFRLVLTQGINNNNNGYLDIDIIFKKTIPEDKLSTLKQLKEAGIIVPAELAYTEAGYKWETVEPMLLRETQTVEQTFIDGEEGFNLDGSAKTEGAVIGDEGAGVQMNGAQVTAATGIVKDVMAGILPKAAGINMLKSFFNLNTEQANALFAGVKAGSVKATDAK